MDELEIMAAEQGIKSKAPSVPMFYKSANRGINLFGRMWELGLMAELYIREFFSWKDGKPILDFRQIFRYNIATAIRMLRVGKLKILPSIARPVRNGYQPQEGIQPVADSAGTSPKVDASAVTDGLISYYPGCSLHATGIEFNMSTKAVADKLNLNLVEPQGWKCCGTSPAHNTDYYRSVKLPMETLALADQMGHAYMTMPCAACFSRFRIAMHEVEHDDELRQRIAGDIGYEYTGGIQVDSLLTTVTDQVGYKAAVEPVVKPLEGLKVACYYGCLLTRPPDVTGEEDYEYPMNMDKLVEAMGAEAVDWSYKTDCCGGSLSLSTLEISLDLSHKILENAVDCGADMIATACPLCHANLDVFQKQIKDEYSEDFDMPVVYFTQLMGVAYGLDVKTLGIDKHFTDAVSLLEDKGLLAQ
jgi:heterodisulfide reductase subunit B